MAKDKFNLGDSRFAGFWLRALAYALDGIICTSCALFVLMIYSLISGISFYALALAPEGIAGQGDAIFLSFFTNIAVFLYSPLMHSSSLQATLGKCIFGIKLIDLEGERVSFLRALARESALLFTIPLVFIVAFTQEKKGLHDMIAGTRVVYS